MNNKSTVVIVVAAFVIVIAAVGGYLIGRGSGDGASKSVYSTKASSRPALNDNKAALIADLETRLKEKPDDEKAIYSLADTYFTMKRFEDAVKYYKKLLILIPDDADVYNDLGLSLHYLGKSGEAVSALETGIEKNPYNQRIWLTKGFVLAYGVGDLDKAGEAWKKARGIDPVSGVGKAAENYLTQINKVTAGEKKADK